MDIRTIDASPILSLKYVCRSCKLVRYVDDVKMIEGAKLPDKWSRFVVDFYGNNKGGPHEEFLCPNCTVAWKRKTRKFFGWPEHTWEDKEVNK